MTYAMHPIFVVEMIADHVCRNCDGSGHNIAYNFVNQPYNEKRDEGQCHPYQKIEYEMAFKSKEVERSPDSFVDTILHITLK